MKTETAETSRVAEHQAHIRAVCERARQAAPERRMDWGAAWAIVHAHLWAAARSAARGYHQASREHPELAGAYLANALRQARRVHRVRAHLTQAWSRG